MDIFQPKKENPKRKEEKRSSSSQEEIFSDVEEQKEVNISKKKGIVPVSNFSEEDDEKQERYMKKKNVLISAGAGLLALLFLFGAGFGYSYFEKYAKKTDIKKLLPGKANVVIKANINPESSQYKLLDTHLAKFPGHERIMKELDEVGEGITISQFINKKLNKRGLDFDQDVKGALGDSAYFLITSLKPIEDLFQQKVSSLPERSGKAVRDYLALSEESLEKKVAQATGETRVLGLTSDYFLMAEENEQVFSGSLDFIVGAEIESLGEARKAIKKMMENAQRYQVEKLSYEGYNYFKVIDKEASSDENVPLNLNTSFHLVIGSNWLMSSAEQELKSAILRHSLNTFAGRLFGFFSSNRGEEAIANALETDQQFNESIQSINGTNFNEDGLATIFYRFDLANILGGTNDPANKPYYEIQRMFKYPDELTGIFSIIVQQDGLKLRMSSNQHSLEEKNNTSFMEGLVKKIPNKLNGRWADVYFEYDNPKSVYYSFKRNNLSEEGLQKWNELLDEIRQIIGVDLEIDLIDQVNGDIAFVGYTGRGLEPEAVMVVGIENQVKVLSTINKILELAKQAYLGISPYAACFVEMPVVEGQGGAVMEQDIHSDPFCASLEQNPAQKKILQEQFKKVLASTIRETETDQGKIYSYNLPGTELSFDFAFKEGQLLFGTHYAIVDAMIKEYGVNPDNMIVSNKYYKQVSQNVLAEGYTKVCLNSFGVWNSVEYYLKEAQKEQPFPTETMDFSMNNDYQKNLEDYLYAIGSIVKTVKLLGGSDAVSQTGNVMSSLYFNIEELPKEQKNKAEGIIKNW